LRITYSQRDNNLTTFGVTVTTFFHGHIRHLFFGGNCFRLLGETSKRKKRKNRERKRKGKEEEEEEEEEGVI